MQLPAGSSLHLRPLGTARFVNMSTAIPIYELGLASDEDFIQLAEAFEKLIPLLKPESLNEAQKQLKQLLSRFPRDPPSHRLLEKLEAGELEPECVWALQVK